MLYDKKTDLKGPAGEENRVWRQGHRYLLSELSLGHMQTAHTTQGLLSLSGTRVQTDYLACYHTAGAGKSEAHSDSESLLFLFCFLRGKEHYPSKLLNCDIIHPDDISSLLTTSSGLCTLEFICVCVYRDTKVHFVQ